MYPSDPSGDTKNEAPTLKKESTLLLQDHSDNHTENLSWPGNGEH